MPSGKTRSLSRVAGNLTLDDVARDGRVLLSHDTPQIGIVARAAGARDGNRPVVARLEPARRHQLRRPDRPLFRSRRGRRQGLLRLRARPRRCAGGTAGRGQRAVASRRTASGCSRSWDRRPAPTSSIYPTGAGEAKKIPASGLVGARSALVSGREAHSSPSRGSRGSRRGLVPLRCGGRHAASDHRRGLSRNADLARRHAFRVRSVPTAARLPLPDRRNRSAGQGGPGIAGQDGLAGWAPDGRLYVRRGSTRRGSRSASNSLDPATGRARALARLRSRRRDGIERPPGIPHRAQRRLRLQRTTGASRTSSWSRACDDPRGRNPARSLRDPRADRRGRDGRGLPRARRAPEARGRDQGAARAVLRRRRPAAALRAGGAGGGRTQSPQHHGGPRPRDPRRRAVHRDGASRGRDAARAAVRRRDRDAQGDRLRGPDREGPRRGAREGDHPSGPQAREPVPDQRRAGEDPGLRPREADAGRDAERPADESADGDRARRRDGHARLHVARAGQGEGRGSALGPLRLRGDPLRDAVGPARVPPRVGGRDDVGDPPGGAAGPLRHEQERPARASSGSCGTVWRRTRRSASTRRATSRSTSRRCRESPAPPRRRPASSPPGRRAGRPGRCSPVPSWRPRSSAVSWPGSRSSGPATVPRRPTISSRFAAARSSRRGSLRTDRRSSTRRPGTTSPWRSSSAASRARTRVRSDSRARRCSRSRSRERWPFP